MRVARHRSSTKVGAMPPFCLPRAGSEIRRTERCGAGYTPTRDDLELLNVGSVS